MAVGGQNVNIEDTYSTEAVSRAHSLIALSNSTKIL